MLIMLMMSMLTIVITIVMMTPRTLDVGDRVADDNVDADYVGHDDADNFQIDVAAVVHDDNNNDSNVHHGDDDQV